MSSSQHYLYQFLPGGWPELLTNPDAWTETDEQIASNHFNYLQQALADKVLIFAGRSLDGIGPAVVVFEAASQEEAHRFMLGDPFVKHSLFRAELHPFRAALVREP